LAARALAPAEPEWHVFGHCGNALQAALLWRRGAAGLSARRAVGVGEQISWRLEAWAVFSNHYHFVGHAPADAGNLKEFLGELHMTTSKAINKLDKAAGRQIWHNFWETQLTYERSYLARLNYVHQNPVRHGLVPVANQYRWCSAAWFESAASRAQVKTIYSFKIDRIRVLDDFEVLHIV
jgi:putative transposase